MKKSFRLGFKFLLLPIIVIFGGCATSNFKPVTDVPSDKALVYIYRTYSYFKSGVGNKIYANQKPITLLYTRNYYPYLAPAGDVEFIGKQVTIGEAHLFDFTIPKHKLAQIKVEAGKTYFLKFELPSTFGLWPKLILTNSEIGAREITNCILAKNLETNLVTK